MRPEVPSSRKADPIWFVVTGKQKVVLELAQKETEQLRLTLEEKESSCNRITARLEQQIQQWAQDLQAECLNLLVLLDHSGERLHSGQLPVRYFIF